MLNNAGDVTSKMSTLGNITQQNSFNDAQPEFVPYEW